MIRTHALRLGDCADTVADRAESPSLIGCGQVL